MKIRALSALFYMGLLSIVSSSAFAADIFSDSLRCPDTNWKYTNAVGVILKSSKLSDSIRKKNSN